MEVPAAAVARYQRSELWISHLTLILGGIAALFAGFRYSSRWGIGLAIGAGLAWLNFRWLRQGVDALTETVAAQRDRRKRKVPLLTYFKAAFRYALIALIVYVIFKYLNVPALSMILGLCALGAATLAVSVHEMLRPQE
jgi:small-conductance mechanosensitive channel